MIKKEKYWLSFFSTYYTAYRKENRTLKLPEYREAIGNKFHELVIAIQKLERIDEPGTLLDDLYHETEKIQSYLELNPINEIIFSNGKVKPLHIKNPILITLIRNATYEGTGVQGRKRKNYPNNLSLLLKEHGQLIKDLYGLGIKDKLILDFITRAVFRVPNGYALNMNPSPKEFAVTKGKSVISLKSKDYENALENFKRQIRNHLKK